MERFHGQYRNRRASSTPGRAPLGCGKIYDVTVRKIDPRNFNIAGRSTAREINRRIALNLVRVHQPLSRADLARRMKTTRGAASGSFAARSAHSSASIFSIAPCMRSTMPDRLSPQL